MTKGERIKKARKDAGFTQTELAKRLGVAKQTVYKYEKNLVSNIPSDMICAIAMACNVTPNFIMGWKENSEKPADDKYALIMYRELDPNRQERINSYIEFLHAEMRTEKKNVSAS